MTKSFSFDRRGLDARVRRRKPSRRLARQRNLAYEALETRYLLAAEVRVRFEFTDTNNNVVPTLQVGDSARLNVYVRDIRPTPAGVFQAYFDLNYNPSLVSVNGQISRTNSEFQSATSGTTTTPGLIDEAGGLDTDNRAPTPRDLEELLFSVPFQVNASGTLNITGDLAESPVKTVILFDSSFAIPLSNIEFVGGSITIVAAGINVTPTTGLVTSEAGQTASFNVVLTRQPTSDVTIGLSSSNPSEGVPTPASLTFTSANWNTPQPVTVTGVNDNVDDGDAAYTIVTAPAVSADAAYSGLNPNDVSVTNTDNDTAGVTVAPTAGLETNEAGGMSAFTVVLNSQPLANVTIGLSSSDTTEGTIAISSVTFTPANWNMAQTVSVTGVDDSIDDDDIAYSIVTAPAVSTDPKYSGLNPADVLVINRDDATDTAGITVSPTSGLETNESGAQATFTVVLNSQPTADVTMGLSSSDTTEGTVLPASLTFTPSNWNMPQTVTVTGADDDIDDDDISYTIVTAPAVSSDPKYSARNAADVAVVNRDDVGETAGITVAPLAGLQTTEAGGTASFTVVLDTQPTADVTIGIASNDTSEGTVGPASLVFTPMNWNMPQTVTLTGADDAIDDGDVAYQAITSPAVSSDPKYSNFNAADVDVTNLDDVGETAGITVMPVAGLQTTEAGGQATFTVVLDTQPLEDVAIAISSSDTSEGTVNLSSVTFTPTNWNLPQTVTVSGVNDDVDDGDIGYSILLASATSADANYQGRDATDPAVTNQDNDTAGITVNPTSGLTTTEAGGTATFTIVLDSEPTGDVTIGLTSSDTSEGTVAPASVLFTPANWDMPQTITITGVDDAVDDDDVAYLIVTSPAMSTDSLYNNLDAADVAVTNLDDVGETAGIIVAPTSGLETTEAGGTASFTVVLATQPTNDVSIDLTSSDTTEGTVSPAAVAFTSANWDVPQTVTVTGVDDSVDDDDVAYMIVTAAASSTDGKYAGLNAADVSVTNRDDPGDVAGITIVPTTGLTTTEKNLGTATFTVVLDTQPTADVTIGLTSSNTAEGTVAPAQVTFSTANWDMPQTVTVTGVDDMATDGDIGYMVVTAPATSSDPKYSGLNAADVSLTNLDDDIPGITVEPRMGLITTESGGTATFTLVLNRQPSASVTIPLATSDATEGTTNVSSVTFSTANWNVPQTVTVNGASDDIDDGDIAYLIITEPATSTDADYNGLNSPDVGVTNQDDDTAGITVTPTAGLQTTESGGTDTFTIVLTSQPIADVTIDLSSSDLTEGTVAPASVTFTASDWNMPQTVTVTGVDDPIADGDVLYMIVTAAAVSGDPTYSGRNSADVSVTNGEGANPDVAGITVSPTAGLVTTESGGTDTFTVVLNTQPTADVTIGVSSSDTSEGTAAPASLTFTPQNWNVPQTVTVTGVDDPIDDDDVVYTIVTAPATSSDTDYSGMNAADVTVTNGEGANPDVAGITVNPVAGLETTESGGTATFTIVLDTQPVADVTIGLSSSDTSEGTVGPVSVTFTPANWNVPQVITVTGVDDQIDDDSVLYSIVTAAATSADGKYNGLNAADVTVTNSEGTAVDTAGVTVNPLSGLQTTESGGTASFTIVLDTQPLADVTIGLSSSDTTEGTVSVASVTFTSMNWNLPQTVTVTGVDDVIDDGSVAYSIVTAAATSGDLKYNGLNAADVSVTNGEGTAADTAGITVTPTSGLQTTESGGTATFTIVLVTEPTADVTIGISSSDTTEGTAAPVSVTFTPVNWNVPQTVTVTGVDDSIDDDSVSYTIVTAAATSADAKYQGLNPSDVAVTNGEGASVDTAGITVVPTAGLQTSESGGTANFTVVLNTEPTANVTIGMSSSDTTEGTVAPSGLTFTPANWNVPQTVIVTGVDDPIADGSVSYTIVTAPATSGDAKYQGLDAADVAVTNDEGSAVDVANIVVTPTSGLQTTESGGTATFSIVLATQPTANVSVGLSSSDTTEGTVGPSSVTFTPANWDVPQIVTVTGVDDPIDDDNVDYMIVTAAAVSADATYNGLNPSDVSVTNSEGTSNETAGITVNPTTGLQTTESGGTATFTIVLNSQPLADVTIGLSSSDATEGTVGQGSVTFTTANWNMPQTVTVTGVNDVLDDDNVTYSIVTAAAVSTDLKYSGLNASDVQVTNVDTSPNAALVLQPTSLTVTEGGSGGSMTIRLASQPSANVVLNLVSSNSGQVTVTPAQITLTPANWDIPQTISVQGVNDSIVEPDKTIPFSITPTSTDPKYSALSPTNVDVALTDDDMATINLAAVAATQPEGTGGTTTDYQFRVTLSAAVEGGFRIAFATNDGTATVAGNDYVDNDGFLDFTGTSGEERLITVRVNHDNMVEPNETFSVSLGAITNTAATVIDSLTRTGSPATATITNDDTATLTIANVTQAEGTGTGTTSYVFNVTLSQPVQGGLTVPFTTNDGTATVADGDYVDNDGSLTFTGTANESRTITVQVNRDSNVERQEQFTVTLSAVTGVTLVGSPAAGIITNDDSATVSFQNATSLAVEQSGTHTVNAQLTVPGGGRIGEAITFNVTAPGGTANSPGDFTLQTSTITFPAGSVSGATQPIQLALVSDNVLETNKTINLQLTSTNDNLGGAVTVGTTSSHQVTLTDDPMTGSVSGFVYVDANSNGARDTNEAPLAGVVVRLTGVDLQNRVVEINAMSDSNGAFRFSDLPGGTYGLSETQPAAFLDGAESLGQVNGVASGTAGNDQFSGIVLAPTQAATNYNFGEGMLRPEFISRRLFLASRSNPTTAMIREIMASAEAQQGNTAQAAAIRQGEIVQVRRVGSEVKVTGTTAADEIRVVPATSTASTSPGQHLVEANGIEHRFAASDVTVILLNGGGDQDSVELRDTSGNDALTTDRNSAELLSPNLRVEVMAIELLNAISNSGGDDTHDEDEAAVDYVLELEGSWRELP